MLSKIGKKAKPFSDSLYSTLGGSSLERKGYKELRVVRSLANGIVQKNFLQIKGDISDIVNAEINRIMNDPARAHLIVKR
jgi:hypothetical protein